MKSTRKPVVKSADRTLDVLEMLAHKARGLTHSELAAELKIPKSSMTQLLSNLVAREYVAFTPGPNTYAIGPALLRLAARERSATSLIDLAQAQCDRITRITGESSSLNMPREDMVQRVCGANSRQPLTFSMTIGEQAPLYAVSSGKVLLAAMDPAHRDAYLARTRLVKITPGTIASLPALQRELRTVAREDIAWSIEEYTPGIVGVAVPVRDGQGTVIGALNVAMPRARDTPLHRKAVVRALRDAAASLHRDLASLAFTQVHN
jgi:DNA-binding IclR family transcriptional regulator